MQEQLQQILSSDGALSRLISNYEEREAQTAMLSDIVKAFNEKHIALIEAGTGVGKSMAYLLPSLLWAIKHKERILVSTHTINLQEQLINKDIPLAKKALGANLKAVLVKGMSNYLCLRKLEDARLEKRTLTDKENEEITQIEEWAEITADGTLSDLKIVPAYSTWEKVCAEGDTCSFRKCPFYDRCHFFKARKEAENAQILVSNHSLLFADLAMRGGNQEGGVLPNYSRVILDEAHRIEDVATNFFAARVSYLSLLRLLGRIGTDRQGKLALLKDKVAMHYSKHTPECVMPIFSRFNIDIPAFKRDLLTHLADFFQALTLFIQQEQTFGEVKRRLLPEHLALPTWKNEIVPLAEQAINSGKRYLQSINQLLNDLTQIPDDKLKEKTEGTLLEVQALINRLNETVQNLAHFMQKECPKEKVRWMEANTLRSMTNIHLIEADLEIGELMAQKLYNPFPTTVLTSATMSTNKNFKFFKRRVGLTEELLEDKSVQESQYLSPFNYANQAKLVIPEDMPHPNSAEFLDAAIERIWDAIQASRGNTFVLFTSHSMMKQCAKALELRLQENRFPLFTQGDVSRKELLDLFRKTDYSVLFGTDSFWEGVDVSGEALRCVVLVKLPFRVPSEPILQARTERIQKKGKDPFMSYHLPTAIVKFKQGFGRLIRNKKDRGCILCLDSRLIKRPYGRQFLNSLPPCQQSVISSDKIKEEMQEFYKKTFYLTKKT